MSPDVETATQAAPSLPATGVEAPAQPDRRLRPLDGPPEPARPHPASRWWRDVRRRRMLAAADLVVAVLAGLTLAGSPWVLAGAPAWILLAKLFGLYDRDHRALRHLTIDEAGPVAAWGITGVGLSAVVVALVGSAAPSFWHAAGAAVVAIAGGLVMRAVARHLWRRFTAPELTVVLGEGGLAASTQRKLRLFDDVHLRIVDSPKPIGLHAGNGSAAELAELAGQVDRLVIATEWVDPELLERVTAVCRRAEIKLSVVSPMASTGPVGQLSTVANLAVLDYETWDVSRSTMLLKRAFDVALSIPLLIVFAPLFPLIALAIRLDSPGPTIFSQLRAGLDEKPFRMYKLRTMTSDAEDRLGEVIALDDLPEPMFKLQGDPRITRVGRWLRRFSIDELPQLVNVLRGEMSLVGPRPEQVELVQRYDPEHRFRLEVKPGITGPMQVHGRGTLTFAERLAVEHDYVEHMSLSRDLRLLLLTVPAILRGTGAF